MRVIETVVKEAGDFTAEGRGNSTEIERITHWIHYDWGYRFVIQLHEALNSRGEDVMKEKVIITKEYTTYGYIILIKRILKRHVIDGSDIWKTEKIIIKEGSFNIDGNKKKTTIYTKITVESCFDKLTWIFSKDAINKAVVEEGVINASKKIVDSIKELTEIQFIA